MTEVTARMIRKNVCLVTAQNENNQVEVEFKITWIAKLSSNYLTKALRKLGKKFRKEGIQIELKMLYSNILKAYKKAYSKRLPPLILTYYD